VNLVVKNLDENHQGIEAGIEKTVFSEHVLQAAVGYGVFVYTNRPTLEAWQDNNSTSLFTDRAAYLTNYRVGGTPQFVTGAGYKYNSKKRWFAGIYFNYFDEIYVEANPDRRTQEAVARFMNNEKDQYSEITRQEQLPGYYVLNANGGASFRIAGKYYLNMQLSINNLLNNTNIIVTGFESLRWDPARISRFDNKYYYMQGLSYMFNLNFNF
jgi:hypothetical protein